jgi:hypothetical protein
LGLGKDVVTGEHRGYSLGLDRRRLGIPLFGNGREEFGAKAEGFE